MTRNKILSLEDMAAFAESQRAEKKTVVHCHGVFDLLHIGHIKHLEEARRLGDVLVVTITPDKLVNKGPHRPVFTEQLRAEALAALCCVDAVAINRTPTAVEAIHLIKPGYYVKGDAKEAGPRDHTDAINDEEAAVQAVGGRLHLTDTETFSATSLINRYTDVFSPEARLYFEQFRAKYSEEDLLAWFGRIKPLRVLTIGETIIDEYNFCDVMNKANKDPILAAKYLYGERYLGGILAVGNHLSEFCAQITCLTALGANEEELTFIRGGLAENIDLQFIRKHDSPTIIKRRYVEDYLSSKLIEIDIMNDDPLTPEDEATFLARLDELIPQHDLVIVTDYGHGLLTDRAIQRICDKAPFLALNVQVNPGNYGFNLVSRYPRADYVVIAEPEARLEMKKKQMDIEEIVPTLASQLGCKYFLLTRGQKGTMGYSAVSGNSYTPVFSSKVVDRIGAGDACLALTAPCAALGAPTDVLGFIGNVAGAAACAVIGNKSYLDHVSVFRNVSSLMR
ncbi:PfkB family carbohydrate kinase [Roseovarius pacificus]|uniref:PfkB family carbohydrate kinase n=1 Tax=Roseovarius pacificus TaxID=337701 RepID=UPI002A18C9C6|nr:PfkB family carbohydrate kinase [Roseovarius pacificus]